MKKKARYIPCTFMKGKYPSFEITMELEYRGKRLDLDRFK